MRRLVLLIAAGSLWLFLAAVPALADGGPHVASINDGSLGINADGCAGCHRAHTAQGPLLINAVDEEALCLTCHGSGGVGSTVDVMTGVQYRDALPPGSAPQDPTDPAVLLGALRNGGFDLARIDSAGVVRQSYPRNAGGDISQRPKVPVLAAGEAVTSAHIAMAENGLTMPGIVWGNGAFGSASAGPAAADLSCASCHNPHGNGQYRILNAIPHLDAANFAAVEAGVAFAITGAIDIAGTSTNANRIQTGTIGTGFANGDEVVISGGTAFDGTYFVESSGGQNTDYAYFRVYAAGTSGAVLDVAPGTFSGSVARVNDGIHVTDAALPPSTTTRNYTVIQTAIAPNQSQNGPVLTAQAVLDAGYGPTEGDYMRRNVPWTPTAVDPDCDPTVFTQPAGCTVTSNDDAPNGLASFNVQINAWCATCHSRYLADGGVPTPGAPYSTDSGDPNFAYRHPTRGNRTCNVCHVGHGSNATMDGFFSSNAEYPNDAVSASSRLLKIDNRGTCQACHDPTETTVGGDLYPTGATAPSAP